MIEHIRLNRVKHKRHTIYVMLNDKNQCALRKVHRVVKYDSNGFGYYVEFEGMKFTVYTENKVNRIYLSEKHTGGF